MQKNKCNGNVMYICMLCSRFTELNYGFYLNMHARRYFLLCECVFSPSFFLFFLILLLFKVYQSDPNVRLDKPATGHTVQPWRESEPLSVAGMPQVLSAWNHRQCHARWKTPTTKMEIQITYIIPKVVTCSER